jgi:hypothetical protein
MSDGTQTEKPNIQTEGRIAPHERSQSDASRFPSVRRLIVVLLIISITSGGAWDRHYASTRESTSMIGTCQERKRLSWRARRSA